MEVGWHPMDIVSIPFRCSDIEYFEFSTPVLRCLVNLAGYLLTKQNYQDYLSLYIMNKGYTDSIDVAIIL